MNRLELGKVINIPKSDPVILYKKLNADMKSPYQLFKYIIGKAYSVKKFNEDVHKNCTKGRIYSIPKNKLTKLAGLRYFKVHIWGRCILEKNDKIGSEYLKVIRELEPEEFIEYMTSVQAYHYCKRVKDVEKVRNMITDSFTAYLYCLNVKDRKEVRDRIVNSEWAYFYYVNVKNRKEVKDRIIEKDWKYFQKKYRVHEIKENAQNKKDK